MRSRISSQGHPSGSVVRAFISLAFWVCHASCGATVTTATWRATVAAGVQSRVLGNVRDSIAELQSAVDAAPDIASRNQASLELGRSFLQAGRLGDADKILQKAYREAGASPSYPMALALGITALRLHDEIHATRRFEEVLATSGDGEVLREAQVSAELNLLRLHPNNGRLQEMLPRVAALGNDKFRAQALFVIGDEATEARQELPGQESDSLLRLSYRAIGWSLELARRLGDRPLAVDAGDALAQLYESQARWDDAIQINRGTIAVAARLSPGQAGWPLARLEWRAARLELVRGGDRSVALASFLRAAQNLDSIRQDLPIEDGQGRSTYQTLQRPIFLGLLSLLLEQKDDGTPPEARQAQLVTALNTIEVTHQAELQDYLGDRCSVDAVSGVLNQGLAPGVAIVYPVILYNRLELLVKIGGDVLQRMVPVSQSMLEEEIRRFRNALLDPGSTKYLESSRRLYSWLIAPFESALTAAGVKELVIVPDGSLRLIPFAALHDDKTFLAQQYWLSTVTGLTMTEAGGARHRRPASLLAGLSTPGPVVDRLIAMGFTGDTELSDNAAARSVRGISSPISPVPSVASPVPSVASVGATRNAALAGELALPGVKTEIEDLTPLVRSVSLLNDQFTVGRFSHEVQAGNFSVVHIASHSFFGGTAGESFLLAYDDVIHIDQLQNLISVNGAQQTGIDLLTLSACDTAHGDNRAPLGFAGAGVRARARSVVGSLWAVSDEATQQFMEIFYASLAQHGKAQAFTEAQRSLLSSAEFSHPIFWAPFILTGDWN